MDLREYQMLIARESIARHGEARQDLEWARTRALIAACASGKAQSIEKHLLYEPPQTKEKLLGAVQALFGNVPGA